MPNRTTQLEEYWCTWTEGVDWPSWYVGYETALAQAKMIAKNNPGKTVYLCFAKPHEFFRLPDKLEHVVVGDHDKNLKHFLQENRSPSK